MYLVSVWIFSNLLEKFDKVGVFFVIVIGS